MEPLRVARVVEVAEMGTIAFFENEPDTIWPWCKHTVRITTPGETSVVTTAEVEFASNASMNEVMVLIFPDVKQSQLPLGSQVEVIKKVT